MAVNTIEAEGSFENCGVENAGELNQTRSVVTGTMSRNLSIENIFNAVEALALGECRFTPIERKKIGVWTHFIGAPAYYKHLLLYRHRVEEQLPCKELKPAVAGKDRTSVFPLKFRLAPSGCVHMRFPCTLAAVALIFTEC